MSIGEWRRFNMNGPYDEDEDDDPEVVEPDEFPDVSTEDLDDWARDPRGEEDDERDEPTEVDPEDFPNTDDRGGWAVDPAEEFDDEDD